MTKVKLRTKDISKNRKSLYLDFYPPIIDPETGRPTRRQFLEMYLYAPIKLLKRTNKDGTTREIPVYHTDAVVNAIYEKHNIDTLQVASQIEAKRQNVLNKPEVYDDFERERLRIKAKGEQCFVKYFEQLANKRNGANHKTWLSALNYLNSFTGGSCKFSDLSETFFEDYKYFLLNSLSYRSNKVGLKKNTTVSYFNKAKAALKQAFKDGHLQVDLNGRIDAIKEEETLPKFLTIEEANMLVKTECSLPVLKQAALFSILTGLRFSDIEKMKWGEIEYIDGQGYYLHFIQEKSEGAEAMPISNQAYSILGERRDPVSRVFESLTYSAWTNSHLFKWISKAGISKDFTFHGFRHTYAVIQLMNGTDIYTLSKMLGHRNLKSTRSMPGLLIKQNATQLIK